MTNTATRADKTFSSKSNAKRGAIAAGLIEGTFALAAEGDRWVVVTAPATAEAPVESDRARYQREADEDTEVAYKALLANVEQTTEDGWGMVYLDNAKPSGWEPTYWRQRLATLGIQGRYSTCADEFKGVWGKVEMPVTLAPAKAEAAADFPPAELVKAAHEAAKTERRTGTKQATLIALLEREEGASVAEIAEATGWLNHTIRGAISGTLKKKLGLEVEAAKEEGRGTVYRINPEA
ncbi:hypothetical protein ATO13_22506 [Stappia sp. 22II-S9-Z10]|nr:hypothetical protein ATO13_22506 [Stappia sp. 22II-S9-Z10]